MNVVLTDNLSYAIAATPIGELLLVSHDRALRELRFDGKWTASDIDPHWQQGADSCQFDVRHLCLSQHPLRGKPG